MAPKNGLIKSEENDAFINQNMGRLAFGYMPPYIYYYDLPPMTMSKLLSVRKKQGDDIEVTEDEKGVLRVTIEWTKPGEPGSTKFTSLFDTNQGGVCSEWTVSGGDTRGTIWKRCEFSNFEVSPGLWAPREIRIVSPMESPPYMDKLELSDIRINPELSPDAFVVEFPIGTYVDDHISKQSYTVTSGAIDEQAAVKEFLRRHRFASAPTGGGWLRWCGLGIVVLIVGGVSWWYLRNRAAIIVLTMSIGTTALADEPSLDSAPKALPSPVDESTDYVISHHPAEKVRVVECGFTVTLFTLEHFGISYDLRHIRSALRRTDRGIRLGDINQLLKVYGLSCEARKNVDPASLDRLVRHGYLIVFPIRLTNKADHYMVGLLGQDGEPKAVDVLRSVLPLNDLLFDTHQTEHSGVVLAVRKDKHAGNRVAMNERLQATPASIDLGALSMNGDDRHTQFVLNNPSSHPVFVKSVVASCGSTNLDWREGIIRAGEQQLVTVTVRPMAWGVGKQRKQITFQCLDDSEIKLTIAGEGQSLEQIHQVSIAPQRLRVEFGADVISQKTSPSQKLVVTGDPKMLDSLRGESLAKWLQVEVAATGEKHREVNVTFSVQNVVAALADAPELTGEIALRTNPDIDPVVVPVIVTFSRFVQVSSRRLDLTQGSSSTVMFQPLGTEAKSVSMGSVHSSPPGLLFDHEPAGTGVKLVVGTDAQTIAGLYAVRCELRSDDSRRTTTNLIVKVTPSIGAANAKAP